MIDRKFREFCIQKLEAAGKKEEDMTSEWMSKNIRKPFFNRRATRDLMRTWESKAKAALH